MEAVSNKVKINILKEISNILKNTFSLDDFRFIEDSYVKIYGISVNNINFFFSKKNELINYLKKNNIDKKDSFIVEYIGEQANRNNVIRVIKGDTIELYSIINGSSYFKLDRELSLKYEIPTWNLVFGNITDYYEMFDKCKVKTKQY